MADPQLEEVQEAAALAGQVMHRPVGAFADAVALLDFALGRVRQLQLLEQARDERLVEQPREQDPAVTLERLGVRLVAVHIRCHVVLFSVPGTRP